MKDFNMQIVTVSVADPGFLSQIPDPSQIPAFLIPGPTAKRSGGKICFPTFLYSLTSQILQQLKLCYFEQVKKKI
jgi:hypothetical protein